MGFDISSIILHFYNILFKDPKEPLFKPQNVHHSRSFLLYLMEKLEVWQDHLGAEHAWNTSVFVLVLSHTLTENEKNAFKMTVVFTNCMYLCAQYDMQLKKIHFGLS